MPRKSILIALLLSALVGTSCSKEDKVAATGPVITTAAAAADNRSAAADRFKNLYDARTIFASQFDLLNRVRAFGDRGSGHDPDGLARIHFMMPTGASR